MDACKTETQRVIWLDHMGEKNWIGEKGLEGLARALSALSESDREEAIGISDESRAN